MFHLITHFALDIVVKVCVFILLYSEVPKFGYAYAITCIYAYYCSISVASSRSEPKYSQISVEELREMFEDKKDSDD